MTKKEVYRKYDINFIKDHILYNGILIPELLKSGNTKTGTHVYTWSLPAGRCGTCKGTCPGCYALTGRYRTKTVIESLQRNLDIVNNDIDFFYRAVSAQLEFIGSGEVRIHAAGDFKTARPFEYANTWRRIAIERPDFLTWTYTKMEEFESLFNGIKNANIVKSIIPGVGLNYGHCDYILNAYNALKAAGKSVYICRCGIDPDQHCENCSHCATSEFVLFIEHSTDYKAAADPLFEQLKMIINSQP